MSEIQLTETLNITFKDKKSLEVAVIGILGVSGDSAAVRGLYNLSDSPTMNPIHSTTMVIGLSPSELSKST